MASTKEVVEDLLLLVAESAALHPSESPARTLLADLENELRLLRQRCVRSASGYKVAVIGLGNVGKSTLINELLGCQIAPVRNGPCTAGVVEFRHGPTFNLEATRPGRLMPEYWRFANVQALHHKLCSLVDHGTRDNQAISRLVVSVSAAVLADGLVLVDTPGFGAAGEEGDADNQIVKDFLGAEAAQVFWVVMADQGILASDLSFYERYLADRCDDLIVTNAENWDEHDRVRWRQRYSPYLRRIPAIHFVSGREAQTARKAGDIAAWEATGLAVVRDRIQSLSREAGRVGAVEEAIERLGAALATRSADAGPSSRLGSGAPIRSLFRRTTAAQIHKKFQDVPHLGSWHPFLIPN